MVTSYMVIQVAITSSETDSRIIKQYIGFFLLFKFLVLGVLSIIFL